MPNPPGALSYYISSLRVRRELIPVYEDESITAYRCLTYAADGQNEGDKVLADQVAFEDELIALKLMRPRGGIQMLFAGAWRGLSLDQLLIRRPVGSQPLETLLPIIA